MLPLAEMEAKDTPQQFADRVQQQLAASLGAKCSSANRVDYNKWLNGTNYHTSFVVHSLFVSDPPRPPPPKVRRTGPTVVGPIIPEAEFPHVPDNMDAMVEQVTGVLPQVPYTVVRRQLSKQLTIMHYF